MKIGAASAMPVMLMADLAENAVRGELFSRWYYPVFMTFIGVLAIAPLVWKRPEVMRIAGWIFFASVISWMTVVRGVLVS